MGWFSADAWRRRALQVLCLSGLCTIAVAAEPAAQTVARHQPQWFAEPYAYVVVDQDVRGALAEMGRNLDLIVVFSDKVRGASRGSIRGETAGEFLDRLCDANQLSWYFDGNVLHIASADEVATREFDVRGRQLDDLESWLQQLDVAGAPMSSRASPDRAGLFVSGPPAYLAQIQQHLDRQPDVEPAPVVRERGVRVFRGGVVTQVTPDA
jgi:type III secretion protein C